MAKNYAVESVSPGQSVAAVYLPGGSERGRRDFVFTHHPRKWDWDPVGKRWLPHLDVQQYTPGLGGTHEVGGQVVVSRFHSALRDAGFLLIEPSDSRLPFPYKARARVQSAPDAPVYAYFPVWMSPSDVAGKLSWDVDVARQREFQAALLDCGIVAPIQPAVASLLVSRKRGRADRIEDELNKQPLNRKLQYRRRVAVEALTAMGAWEGGEDVVAEVVLSAEMIAEPDVMVDQKVRLPKRASLSRADRGTVVPDAGEGDAQV